MRHLAAALLLVALPAAADPATYLVFDAAGTITEKTVTTDPASTQCDGRGITKVVLKIRVNPADQDVADVQTFTCSGEPVVCDCALPILGVGSAVYASGRVKFGQLLVEVIGPQ